MNNYTLTNVLLTGILIWTILSAIDLQGINKTLRRIEIDMYASHQTHEHVEPKEEERGNPLDLVDVGGE